MSLGASPVCKVLRASAKAPRGSFEKALAKLALIKYAMERFQSMQNEEKPMARCVIYYLMTEPVCDLVSYTVSSHCLRSFFATVSRIRPVAKASALKKTKPVARTALGRRGTSPVCANSAITGAPTARPMANSSRAIRLKNLKGQSMR